MAQSRLTDFAGKLPIIGLKQTRGRHVFTAAFEPEAVVRASASKLKEREAPERLSIVVSYSGDNREFELLLDARVGGVLGAFVKAREHRIVDLLSFDQIDHDTRRFIAHFKRPLADKGLHTSFLS